MKPRFFLPAAVSGALFASVASGSTPTAAADGAETALKRAGEWLVAAQNEDGSFKDNGSGKDIPASPMHPKFRERWLRAIVQDHGDVVRQKEVK